MNDLSDAPTLESFALSDIAHIEMGQAPDSRYVVEDPFQGKPFLQGNAEFGAIFPTPRFGCLHPAKVCEVNDVLISVRAPVGAVNLADRDYCIGRGLAAIRVRGMKPSLLGEVISRQSSALRRVAQGTTFEAITKNDLLSLKVKLPPKAEWPKIAEILDTCDAAIQKTEELIDNLKAIKQGLLHDLLTRGIDASGRLRPQQPEAPHLYKESPLGWIPQEWEDKSFTDLQAQPILGVAIRGASETGQNFGLVKMGNLGASNELDLGLVELVASGRIQNLSRYLLEDGDLLFNTRNTPDLVGKTCSWHALPGDHVFDNNILRARIPSRVGSGHFFAHYLGSDIGRRRLLRLATGTTSVAAIYWKDLSKFNLPVPPPDEQMAIHRGIESLRFSRLCLEEELKKLRENKSALMDDLLTGRVRVTPLLKPVQA